MSYPYSNDPGEYPTRGGRPGQVPPQQRSHPQPTFDTKPFFAGVAATALTTFLAGTVAAAIVQAIYRRMDTPVVWMYGNDAPWVAGVCGAVAALLAGGVLLLLFQGVPSPGTFFGWISALVVIAVIVLPFLAATSLASALGAAIVNGLMGIVIATLLSTTRARTFRGRAR